MFVMPSHLQPSPVTTSKSTVFNPYWQYTVSVYDRVYTTYGLEATISVPVF